MAHEEQAGSTAAAETARESERHHDDQHHQEHHGDDHHHHHHDESKYFLDIEGKIHPWPVSIVIPEQVAELGEWAISVGVLEIDADNNERTVPPGQIVHLKPGIAFAKKVHWKRGR